MSGFDEHEYSKKQMAAAPNLEEYVKWRSAKLREEYKTLKKQLEAIETEDNIITNLFNHYLEQQRNLKGE